ncbi:MAG TPA: hypothetical protein DIU35_08370 [Candidatus Latescibacteria bacterium]|nr:hypothetical protein [Candidatus Latescibacterota bacterium]
MPPKKTRNKSEREAHLNLVAQGIRDGKTMRQQMRELDRSMYAIQYDRAQLKMRWAKENNQHIQMEKFDQLEKLNRIEEEAWEAWDRSVGETVKQTRRVTQKAGAQTQIVSEETVTLAGDPRFLEQVNKVVVQRRAILGLDAPKEVNVESNNTTVNVEANVALGIQQAARFLADALGRDPIGDAAVVVPERPVLPPGLRMQEGGREQAVDSGQVQGGGAESERPSGSVGEGALQEHDHHVRPDDTGRAERPGTNGVHSELQPPDSKGIPPPDQGRTGEQ